MTVICPACKKTNEESEARACSRCGCDLSALREILAAAVAHLSRAKNNLRQADWAAALVEAEYSWKLLHTAHSAHLAALASAAMGNVHGLQRWRQRVAHEAPAPLS